MIELTPDPDDMPRTMPPEHCCFCGRATRMWAMPNDVAVCDSCAQIRQPSELPTKDQWWDSPQAKGIAPGPDVDWYDRRDELEPDQVFIMQDGARIMLDRRVPGDGSAWYVATALRDGGWCHDDTRIEPGDLRYLVED